MSRREQRDRGGWASVRDPHEAGVRRTVARSAERSALRRLQSRERRRRVSTRTDVVAGVLVALLLILLAPGLAIVALIALLGLLVCGVWLVLERARGRRRGGGR